MNLSAFVTIALLAFPLPRSTPPTLPTGKHVLRSSELKLTGVQLLPILPNTYQNPAGSLALRPMPDGSKNLIWISRLGQEIVEVQSSGWGTSIATAPRAKLVKNYGKAIYGNCRQPAADLHLETQVVFWDRELNGIWCIYADSYAVTNTKPQPPCILFVRFNADGSTTPFGPWSYDVGPQLVRNYLTVIPQWARQFCGGRRLAAGSGLESGTGSESWGPGLLAIDVPDLKLAPLTQLSTLKLLHYPSKCAEVDPFAERYRRDSQYLPVSSLTGQPQTTSSLQYPLPNNGLGYWLGSDALKAACWVDTPTASGVIVAGRLAYGQCWYGEPVLPTGVKAACGNAKGENASQYSPRWFFYDPTALLSAAAGHTSTWSAKPSEVIDPVKVYGANLVMGCPEVVNAMVQDGNTLYVVAPAADHLPNNPSDPSLVFYRFSIQ